MSLSQSDATEILGKVRDIHAVFIGIEGQPGRFQDLSDKVEKQGRQIRTIERFQWGVTGAGAALGYIAYHLAEILNAFASLKKVSLPLVPGLIPLTRYWVW